MIPLQKAKNLRKGDIVYSITRKDSTGEPSKFKVNSKPKTKKRSPGYVKLTLKHGLFEVLTVDHEMLNTFSLDATLIESADRLIENKDEILYEIRDIYLPGQIVDNIIHLSMFKCLVVAYLEGTAEEYVNSI